MADCYRAAAASYAGNGGSAADSEHMGGELMKSFLFKRKVGAAFESRLIELYGGEGAALAAKLEGALPAIPLTSMPALTSAFANDVDAAVSFAQMTYGYGSAGDLLFGISTSGNSKNVIYALMAAKAKGLFTVGLTGRGGGKMIDICDVTICVPEEETYKVQELHLPVYHTLCLMLEAEFFK
jgi:D-sedoheptulose 7-phosphate isomerase